MFSLPQLPPFFHHYPSENFKVSTLLLPNWREHFSWKSYDEPAQTGAGTGRKGNGLAPLPLPLPPAVQLIKVKSGSGKIRGADTLQKGYKKTEAPTGLKNLRQMYQAAFGSDRKLCRCSCGEMSIKGFSFRSTANTMLQSLCMIAPSAVILALDLHFSKYKHGGQDSLARHSCAGSQTAKPGYKNSGGRKANHVLRYAD